LNWVVQGKIDVSRAAYATLSRRLGTRLEWYRRLEIDGVEKYCWKFGREIGWWSETQFVTLDAIHIVIVDDQIFCGNKAWKVIPFRQSISKCKFTAAFVIIVIHFRLFISI
jgi:hypothetical protein